jgi:hypothetical protein
MSRMLGGTVAFDVPREVAFDYLVEPVNRSQWQSSLARVEQVTGRPQAEQTWVDVTRLGVRPHMRTTTFVRPREWGETGSWRGVGADLTLRFDATVRGCLVRYRFRVRALGPLGVVATLLAVPAVRADLRRAARILSSATS